MFTITLSDNVIRQVNQFSEAMDRFMKTQDLKEKTELGKAASGNCLELMYEIQRLLKAEIEQMLGEM